jgi:hypothetical protein
MPSKKNKSQRKAIKRAKALAQERAARKAGLAAMRAKLLAKAQAADRNEEPKVMEELPQLSKRQRRVLKNRSKI